MQVDREELAWAAGFFDGEGHTYLKEVRFKFYLGVTMSSCSFDDLLRFKKAVGIGNIVGPYKPARNSVKEQFHWGTQSHMLAQAVLAMLWFKLGFEKKSQAIEALRGYNAGINRSLGTAS